MDIEYSKIDIKKAAGLWSELKETGVGYERRLRRGWKKRKPTDNLSYSQRTK